MSYTFQLLSFKKVSNQTNLIKRFQLGVFMKFFVLLGLLAIQTVSASELIQCGVAKREANGDWSTYGSLIADLSKNGKLNEVQIAGLKDTYLLVQKVDYSQTETPDTLSLAVYLYNKKNQTGPNFDGDIAAMANVYNYQPGTRIAILANGKYNGETLQVYCSTNLR
jgi:hypothetical protein